MSLNPITLDLNTSHVNVNPKNNAPTDRPPRYLNTSHVNVNRPFSTAKN